MWRIILTISLVSLGCDGRVTCRNDNNGEVDWFILYKSPRMASADDPNLTGLRYLYIDSRGMRKLDRIDRPNSALGHTLQPILKSIRKMEPRFGFLSYSDQPPGCNADPKRFGHSKGLLMVEHNSAGVWLLHSTPQFPFRREPENFWPPSGSANAQTFICVTFNYDQFQKIGTHLQHIRAFPFDHDIPDSFHQELKDAAKWTENSQQPNEVLIQDLTSTKGKTLRSFAKKVSDDVEEGDLYVTIAENIHSNMHVQVWGCQRDESHGNPGECVINIDSIKNSLGEWKPATDHSKWCVAGDQNRHWTCIADVNRGRRQYGRYGGALCIEDTNVQNKFLQFAKVLGNCRKRPVPSYPECDSDSDTVPMLDSHLLLIPNYNSGNTGNDTETHINPSQMG
ncbi:deoxyribonuclease-2-beta-like [Kryptolebias marmoratus]|uniref:Deoxyribonuclease-2-alpha n=1 Tax=Kryptolebias marmoratus TaxID=37003 RepID=A0A3Q3H0U7_KRYMA|nr:deoxyribonuclease-2-beta-like [Kryptolebias marmoratus]